MAGNGTIYAGGSFAAIGGAPRSNLAALDPTTGVPTTWNPAPDDTVNALALGSDGAVYAGGSFEGWGTPAVAGHRYLAAIDPPLQHLPHGGASRREILPHVGLRQVVVVV